MEKLTKDPRYEAGISLRKEGQYEDAIEFFSELLKSFDDESEDPPIFLAPLYYDYGSPGSALC